MSLVDPLASSSAVPGFSLGEASSVRDKFGSWARPTLRLKGVITLVALGIYFAIVVLAFNYEHQQLSHVRSKFRQIHMQEEILAGVSTLLAGAKVDPDLDQNPKSSNDLIVGLRDSVTTIRAIAPLLSDVYPTLLNDLQGLAADVQRDRGVPLSRAELGRIRARMYHIVGRLSEAWRDVGERRTAIAEEYRRVNDRITVMVVGAAALGVTVFGVIITLFLGKLASDVRQVQRRALDVALGYRGPPLAVTRHDEVGGMMSAVNRMQLELREREKQLEVSRHQRAHQDKMAAVGSLAAAVAHEINNPIEAISGMAQRMTQAQSQGKCSKQCQPQLILEQTQRIADITRNIAQVTAPRSPQPQLLDLNAIVRNTCKFISYDKRFSGVDVTQDLAHDLRAIKAVPDHLMQILMNLLINAADALVGLESRRPAIRVATRAANGEVIVTVEDNGPGMFPEVLSQVFQEYFTTKPAESGGGLGLFLCKVLIEQNGGSIDIDSTPGIGTTASLHLPLPPLRPPA